MSAPDGEPSDDAVFEHDAFISYKQRTEGGVAAALESGLEHLAKAKSAVNTTKQDWAEPGVTASIYYGSEGWGFEFLRA